jgi:hypothetical protein
MPDMPVDMGGCVSPAKLEAIVRGDLTIDATQTQNTAALTVPLDRSVLIVSMRQNEPSPRHGGVTCQLHDADMTAMTPAGITCDRATAGTDTGNGTVVVHYTVATFSTGVSVQRGIANTNTANPVTTAITAVDLSKSFVLLAGSLTGGSGWGNNEFIRARLTGPTTLEVATNAAGTQVFWQVVTVQGATVQRGSAALAMTETQKETMITAAPPGSFVLASYTTDNASGIAAATMMLRAAMMDNDTLVFDRDLAGSVLDVAWEVVRLPFPSQQFTTMFAAAEPAKAQSVSGVMTDKTIAFATTQALLGQGTGSTAYAGAQLDLPGEAAATIVVGAGSVQLQRTASEAATSITWNVVDFSRECM